MKLITLFPAFLLLVAVPVNAQWVEAPPMPFAHTPEAFKAFVNKGDYGMTIIKAEQCEFAQFPATNPNSVSIDFYQCDRTFYETTDPRGTQRCMGKAGYKSMSHTDAPNAFRGFFHNTLKNDCRWL